MESSTHDHPDARSAALPFGPRLFTVLSLSVLISTILLIMVGSIVRVTGHGLGCPDWPLCYGQAVPPPLLGAWVEFTHRLFSGLVVAQVSALIVLAVRQGLSRRRLFRSALFAGVLLALQIVLGGVHVIYELPRWTGWVHTALAMLIAGLLAMWVALSHPGLRDLGRRTMPIFRDSRLPVWTAVTTAGAYLLLLTGSLVTRFQASLVCPGFPACGLETVSPALRPFVLIQMTHRWTAFAVAFAIGLVLWRLVRQGRREPGLRRFAWVLAVLLVLQFSLGMANVWLHIPMWSRVLHLGTGATIWVLMVMLTTTLLARAD